MLKWRGRRRRALDRGQPTNQDRFDANFAAIRADLARIAGVVEDAAQAGETQRSGRAYLSIAVVFALLCAAAAWFAIAASREPELGGKPGAIEVLVDGQAGEPVGVQIENLGNSTTYSITFPIVTRTTTWSVVLFGRAMLSDVTRDHRVVNGWDHETTSKCNAGAGLNPVPPKATACQVFYGSLHSSPRSQNTRRIFSECGPRSALYQSVAGPDGVIPDVVITGTSGAVGSKSRFSQVVTLPLLLQPPDLPEDGIYPITGPDGVQGGEIASAVGCDVLSRPNDYVFADKEPDPDFMDSNSAYWTASGGSNPPSVSFKKPWTGAALNGAVIAAGVFFALTAGFLPLWLQARFLTRGRRKRA